ncbi:GGDEF domain-containing protein [Bythopirellula polymerisocia]|nr:GGDEF domain-containing protein [Bythopirellula polymerisocia]
MSIPQFPLPIRGICTGACIIDFAEDRVLATNDLIRQWIGSPIDPISNDQLFSLIPDLKSAMQELNGTSPRKSTSSNSYQINLHRNGQPVTQATVYLSSLESNQNLWHLLLIQPNTQTNHLASYSDVVTGLPDRRVMEDWRQQWGYRNPGEPCPHALLFLDLNDFKQINDKHGHANGDRILAILAERWQESLRDDDLVVRYGGDEFVVLLAGVQSIEEAIPVVDRLRATAEEPLLVEGREFSVSVSIGIALANDLTVPMDDMLETADRNMYAQKQQAKPNKSRS